MYLTNWNIKILCFPPRIIVQNRFFGECFGPLILNNYMRVLILTLYCSYIFGAVVGCLHFKEGLEPSHLVTTDHYIGRYFDDMKVFWKTGPQLHVAILSPPRLTDPIQRFELWAQSFLKKLTAFYL